MKAEFTALVQQLIAAQGKDALFNITKCKAFLAAAQGQNLTERRLLQQVVESGVTSGIANAYDMVVYKAQAVQKLQADYYLAPNVANGVVDVLIELIKTPAQVQQPATVQTVHQPPIQHAIVQQTLPPVNQQSPQSPPIVQPIYQQVNTATPQFQNQATAKLRHGFASFWLWLCYIGNIIGSITTVVSIVFWNDIEPWLLGFVSKDLVFISCISCVASSVCLRQILHWKKWGFWGLVLIQIGLMIFSRFELRSIISAAISMGIIWGVLHFRNAYNAKTAWEQLE
jgi:hypothetical protein